MVRILLVGCNGRMGSVVTSVVSERSDCTIVAGIDIDPVHLNNYPVYKDFSSFDGEADVIIDFSHPSSLPGILEYAVSKHIPAVIATTGLKDEDIAKIKEASEKTAYSHENSHCGKPDPDVGASFRHHPSAARSDAGAGSGKRSAGKRRSGD